MANINKTKAFIPLICIAIVLLTLTFTMVTVIGADSVGNSYYIDSSAKKNGSGTQSSPFNTLDVIDELSLRPGDSIYIKKGSVFEGSLSLIGINGNEQNPITIGSYGEGARPRINGYDAIGSGVLYIENCSYITVSDLEICDTATYAADRCGVLIYGTNGGASSSTINSIILDNLYVHHIRGIEDINKTGGIVALCDSGVKFDGLTVTNCYITDIDGAGIAIGNEVSGNSNVQHTLTNISSNRITDVSGNAVYLNNLKGGSVFENTVLNTVGDGCFVVADVNETLIEKNETYNNTLKKASYYAADSNTGVVFRYNYSHDNKGGFFCFDSCESFDSATVCYNISVNDGGFITDNSGAQIKAYNNTVVCTSTVASLINLSFGTLDFKNNIIYNTSDGSKISISSNVSADIEGNLVYTSDGSISGLDYFMTVNKDGVYADPLFVTEIDGNFKAGYGIESACSFCLDPSSVAINGGVDINGAECDFFGNSPSNSIGFYTGDGETSDEVDYEMNADDFSDYKYSDIEVVKDIVYGTAISYKGNEKELKLDMYFANDCTLRNRPLLVMIHGGGLRSDSTKEQSYAVKISKLMASKGYVVASINYRTREGSDMPTKADSAPALMDAAEDANTAIEWLRAQGGVYGYNPDYIFVAGGSAGGATAMTYAFAENSRGFNKSGIVAVANLWGGPRDVFADCYDSDFSQNDNFPTIFIHGTGDTTMEYTHSLNTYERMKAKGITVSWNPISGAEHSLIGTDDTYEMTVGLISSFFTDRLAEKLESEGYTQPPTYVGRDQSDDLPTSTSEIIYPNADLYVNSNSYGKNASFHSLDSLYVYDGSNSSYIRHTYMRFDVVDGQGRTPSSVVLNFTVTSCTGVTSAKPLNIAIYGVSDNHWFENEVTWKNSPDSSDRLYIGTVAVTGAGTYSIDVTNYVYESGLSGVPTVTFCFEGKDSPSSSRRATIASVESGKNAPYLACGYPLGEMSTHSLTVKTQGVGSSDIIETKVVDGSSITLMLKPGAGYVLSDVTSDTSHLGVITRVNGNEVVVENIVADTCITVLFTPSSSILLATDSTTVRYNSQSDIVVNTTDTSIDGNINPLFLCTKGPSGGKNNGSDRIIWLSFDISDFDVRNDSVFFEIYCYKVVDFNGATMPVDVYATTNTDWSSETLAWGNQPTVDNLGFRDGEFNISGGAQKVGEFSVTKGSMWYSVDITSYVSALKLSGFTRFSLCLIDNDYTKTAPMARFVSTHGTAEHNGESLAPRLNKESGGSSDGENRIDLNLTCDNEHGSVSGYTNLYKDGSAVINIVPDEGYSAIATVNGEKHAVVNNKLCIYGVNEETKINISFVKEYIVMVESATQIKVDFYTERVVDGDNLTVEFTVLAGYKPKVSVNGKIVEAYNNAVVFKPEDDTTIVIEALPIN